MLQLRPLHSCSSVNPNGRGSIGGGGGGGGEGLYPGLGPARPAPAPPGSGSGVPQGPPPPLPPRNPSMYSSPSHASQSTSTLYGQGHSGGFATSLVGLFGRGSYWGQLGIFWGGNDGASLLYHIWMGLPQE